MSGPALGVVTLDLHGKNAFQARICIDAALRRSAGAYRLRLVHGYLRGNVLSDVIRSEYANNPKVLRAEPVSDGVTELVLREY